MQPKLKPLKVFGSESGGTKLWYGRDFRCEGIERSSSAEYIVDIRESLWGTVKNTSWSIFLENGGRLEISEIFSSFVSAICTIS